MEYEEKIDPRVQSTQADTFRPAADYYHCITVASVRLGCFEVLGIKIWHGQRTVPNLMRSVWQRKPPGGHL
jgi:hypothetical protein